MIKDNAFKLMNYFGKNQGWQAIEKKKQFLEKARRLRKRRTGRMSSLEVLRQLRGELGIERKGAGSNMANEL